MKAAVEKAAAAATVAIAAMRQPGASDSKYVHHKRPTSTFHCIAKGMSRKRAVLHCCAPFKCIIATHNKTLYGSRRLGRACAFKQRTARAATPAEGGAPSHSFNTCQHGLRGHFTGGVEATCHGLTTDTDIQQCTERTENQQCEIAVSPSCLLVGYNVVAVVVDRSKRTSKSEIHIHFYCRCWPRAGRCSIRAMYIAPRMLHRLRLGRKSGT